MSDGRMLVPFSELSETQARQARAIYEGAFADDERVPFEGLVRWLSQPNEQFLPRFEVLVSNDSVIGIAGYGLMLKHQFGYLAYLAIVEGRRSQGHGAWLCEHCFETLRQLSCSTHGQDPRLTFWEVRRPDEEISPEEREKRQRRIRFYERLGAQVLPVDYLCPPINEIQPAVRFHLMARTYPPGRPLSKQDLTDIALAGLVDINGAAPDSEYVRLALQSIR